MSKFKTAETFSSLYNINCQKQKISPAQLHIISHVNKKSQLLLATTHNTSHSLYKNSICIQHSNAHHHNWSWISMDVLKEISVKFDLLRTCLALNYARLALSD